MSDEKNPDPKHDPRADVTAGRSENDVDAVGDEPDDEGNPLLQQNV